jgi:predicted transposase/invertase (TIGR01784 family)
MGVFIDPCTDYGFKRIFGDEELLINFLNSLLEGERVITKLEYMNNERVAKQKDERRVIYDLYCKTDTGEHIIVEMQKRSQKHFKDRALYYSACSIVEQGTKGDWNYELTPVYGVFFIDFVLDTDVSDYYCKDVTLVEKYSGKVFSNKLRHIFIELPRFMKSKSECDSFFECWIYNLANMKEMNEMTFKDRDAIFGRLEEIASRANLTKEERAQYEYEWKVYNDYYNCLDHAEEKGLAIGMEKGMEKGLAKGLEEGMAKGLEEGMAKEKLEIARNLKTMGLPSESISQATGLTLEQIEKL